MPFKIPFTDLSWVKPCTSKSTRVFDSLDIIMLNFKNGESCIDKSLANSRLPSSSKDASSLASNISHVSCSNLDLSSDSDTIISSFSHTSDSNTVVSSVSHISDSDMNVSVASEPPVMPKSFPFPATDNRKYITDFPLTPRLCSDEFKLAFTVPGETNIAS